MTTTSNPQHDPLTIANPAEIVGRFRRGPKDKSPDRPSRPGPEPRGHIGWIVAGSLATGLVAALLLVAAPFIPAEEGGVTGAVLCGFALGWAMLAALSVRFTDQPQRWAAAPALFMGLGGLLLVGFGSPVHEVLSWV
jgi:peptidoglycan/LPS O-acetylase OafA/YrhL